MATYILLLRLTPDGQARALEDPDYLLQIEREIDAPGVQTLGVYAVLGEYDFVTMIAAEGNENVARFSIALGVKAGVHVTTLPVVPAGSLTEDNGPSPQSFAAQQRPETGTLQQN
jgi:uncharacterized protein with GYD domain